ncbi:MAG: patatin-like phospholipase family protein [Anaerolineales bacterium]|nr:patatin-like phospholipase family protein [Anaerolineales bacterium]
MDICLALGGGGVRGNAHIGVLKVLEREGFKIRALAGTSAGGLAAVAYAAGFSPGEIALHILRAEPANLFTRQPGDGPALMGIAGLTRVLTGMLGDRTFADVQIPCAVTACDLNSGGEIILREGSLVEALQATVAIPGIFPAKAWDDKYLLVDGAIVDPVPVSVARRLAPGLPVVAVVLSPSPNEWAELPATGLFKPPHILERVTRLRVAQAFDIFVRSIDRGAIALTESRLQLEKPEVIIRPAVGRFGLLDRVDISEVMRQGEIAAEAALPQLRRAVRWPNRVRIFFRANLFRQAF